MKRSEIFNNILDDIANRIVSAGLRNADWKSDFDIALSSSLSNGAIVLKAAETVLGANFDTCYSQFLHFIESQLTDSDSLEEDISVPSPVLRNVIEPIDIVKMKSMVSSVDPIVFTTMSLFSHGTLIDFSSDIGNRVWKGVERLWSGFVVGSAEAETFWNFCRAYSDKHYYIQTTISGGNPSQETSWKIYSFAYLRNVNESRFEVPELLQVIPGNLSTSLSFDIDAKYEQFFDVCDVLNEIKFADDVLMKFLKVYQVLEQLAYRKKFIKLIGEHVRNHHPIVRSIEAVTNSFKQNELSVFEDLFADELKHVYDSIDIPDARGAYSGAEPACLSIDVRDLVKKLYSIKYSGARPYYSHKQMGDLVYKIRCSIVHNKETEMHFTFNNIYDYEPLIGLIKELSKVMCQNIIELINDGINKPLTYSDRELKLY